MHSPSTPGAGPADLARGLAAGRLGIDIAFGLRSFSLDVALSIGLETLALVGPSGAGKTTVLRRRRRASPARPRKDRARRPRVVRCSGGHRPTTAAALGRPCLSGVRAVSAHDGARERRVWRRGGASTSYSSRFGIAALADERPTHLSGGERQRVALARALARDPAVLLLDEPLSALDSHTRGVVRAELQDLLAELALPTLLVTHDFGDAAALAQRIGVVVDVAPP